MFSSATVFLPLLAAPLALAQTYASTTTFTFAGAALPTGLVASDWPIGEPPYQHEYKRENAVVSDGFLNLIVYGGQEGDEVITSAEVSTDFTVASARVETYAILTDVPGVCNGRLRPNKARSSANISSRNVLVRIGQPRSRHRMVERPSLPVKH